MIESKRISMRKLVPEDLAHLSFLADDDVMYAWNGGFSEEGVREWLEKSLRRYNENGCGHLLAVDKGSGEVIGAIGLIFTKDLNGRDDWEVAYILRKECWGKGYASEGAAACIKYARDIFGADRVVVQMRSTNSASEAVAKRLGLIFEGEYVRSYMGEDMPHKIYAAKGEVLERF